MSIAVTNRTAAPAQRGQGVKVILDATDSAQLANLTVGQTCTITSSAKTGKIASIDLYGNSFIVNPSLPNARFDSTASGILSVSETITAS